VIPRLPRVSHTPYHASVLVWDALGVGLLHDVWTVLAFDLRYGPRVLLRNAPSLMRWSCEAFTARWRSLARVWASSADLRHPETWITA
jgi:hypothetical protein